MSMPSFPPNGADLTQEEALTMIIASIAMEELALSHIINAEGEKLQYILGALPGTNPCATPQDVLAVNKSVASLLDVVAQNQMLLKSKLEKVLEVCPLPPPPPPCRPKPCPDPPPYPTPPSVPTCPPQCPGPSPFPRPVPCAPLGEKSALQLAAPQEKMLWMPDCRLPWRQRNRSGKNICWDRHDPAQIQLNSGKTYLVQYTLNICDRSSSGKTGTILLRQSPCGAFTDAPPLCFSLECLTHGAQTLQHVSVLHPCANSGCMAELSLVLNAKTPLCVEWAMIDIVEL